MTAGRRKRRVGDVSSRPKRLTPNQIVAFNLTRARTDLGWSQPEAAAALEPFLGVRWSRASYSAVERSVDGVRIKQFSADELVAIARCFDRPISWFLTPLDGVVAATHDRPNGLDARVLQRTLRSTRTT
jgi:transcriptional regulator with XRE-family HTH domain